ncbi:MAG: DUF2184 domain-containing protein [Stenomitos rutilans HA7619-LM2]|jgi:hypothetical protein|nr:DUF2184 domain-containing protein [Stenomitos rutilans HA7619-LM2]MBW4469455.1 DUF2184 domain-containing protein [Stenomitos rutilans HA7619-LM2]
MTAAILDRPPVASFGLRLDTKENIQRTAIAAASVSHLDAGEGLFFARQLEYIVPQLYQVKYAEQRARVHFPVSFEGGNGIKTITYRAIDRRGKAKIVTNWSTDFPRVNVLAREVSNKVVSLGDSYGYDFQEIRSAAQANTPLEQLEANAAQMAITELENSLAYFGDANANVYGAFNNPSVPITYAAYPLALGGTLAVTVDQVVSVFNTAINGVLVTSRGVERVNMILVPLKVWTFLSVTRLGSYNDRTLMEYLEKVFPGVVFDWCNECSGAGPNGQDIMFSYVRDDMHCNLLVPSDFEQLPVFSDGATFSVKCHERFAGVRLPYPASCLLTILQ